LANVNRTKNAGITYRLAELGFGTNKENAKVLTEDVEEYAKKLVKTLTGTTNDKKPSASKPKKTTVKKPVKTKNKANLTTDGKWGNSTTKALQKALGTPVDGIISKQPRNSVSN